MMSLETLRKYCNLCGSPLGESVEQVSEHLSARHMIGSSCADVLAINLFTSHQARQEVWTILKDMETMRQNLEIMRSRTQMAEKHATMLAFLTEDLRRKHEEDKAKNNKLIQLVYLKEEEIRCYKRNLISQEENNNRNELSLEKQSLSDRRDLLNDIIDIKLQQVESKRDRGKLETESEEILKKYEEMRLTLIQTELQLRKLEEKKLITEKELEVKCKDEEDAVLSCNKLKEENVSQKVKITEMKKQREKEQEEQKSKLQGKDDIICELTLRVEAQKEQELKKSLDMEKYQKEKEYFEEEISGKNEVISKLKTSYNQSQKEITGMKNSLEVLYSDNYFLYYIISVLLFVIAGLI